MEVVKGNGDKETETEPNKSQIESEHNRAAKVLGSARWSCIDKNNGLWLQDNDDEPPTRIAGVVNLFIDNWAATFWKLSSSHELQFRIYIPFHSRLQFPHLHCDYLTLSLPSALVLLIVSSFKYFEGCIFILFAQIICFLLCIGIAVIIGKLPTSLPSAALLVTHLVVSCIFPRKNVMY